MENSNKFDYTFRYETFYALDVHLIFKDHLPLRAYYTSEEELFDSFNTYMLSLSEEQLKDVIKKITGEPETIKNISWEYNEPVEEHEVNDYFYEKQEGYISLKFDCCKSVRVKKEILGMDGITYSCLVDEKKITTEFFTISIMEIPLVFCN